MIECSGGSNAWTAGADKTVVCAEHCTDGSTLQCIAKTEKELICSSGHIVESGVTRVISVGAPQTQCPIIPPVTPPVPPTPPAPECVAGYEQWLSAGDKTMACPQLCADGSALQCLARIEKQLICSAGSIKESGVTRVASIAAPQTQCPAIPEQTKTITEIFNVPSTMGKADILFIIDTSLSMDTTLRKISTRLASLTSKLGKTDWQIGITNAGVGDGYWQKAALSGKIMYLKKSAFELEDQGRKILLKSNKNAASLFEQSIARPANLGILDYGKFCAVNPYCMQSWVKPQPLKAIMHAIDEANGENKGFFRSNSHFIPIIISDADENEDGQNDAITAAKAAQYYADSFKSNPQEMLGFSVVIPPGDSACLKKHQNLFSDGIYGRYGTFAAQFSKITGGDVLSLCDDDYASNLAKVSDKIREKVERISIAQTPIEGSLQIQFSSSTTIKWKLVGKTIVFDRELPVGIRVTMTYKIKK